MTDTIQSLKTIIFLLIGVIFIELIMLKSPTRFRPIASVRMDGLGYYLVDNYVVMDKCIVFIDNARNPVSFCGAYEVKNL